MSPLEYMLRVVNNPRTSPERRDRMALAAVRVDKRIRFTFPRASSSPTRQQRYRDRVAAGRFVVRLELDEVETVQMLVEAGMLDAETEDRAVIKAALQAQIEALIRYHQLKRDM